MKLKISGMINMGDIGVDKWFQRMEDHKRRDDPIIGVDRNSDIEAGLFLKEQRVSFWEKNHRIPNDNDLRILEAEA
jgi:hypothetical protein